jgi:hypothetical protein
VTELVLRCQTTGGVVERRFKRDDECVVSRSTSLRSALGFGSHFFQLWNMGLTEVPSALFRVANMKSLHLDRNNLCSLPSKVALLTRLEWLNVRTVETQWIVT